MSQETHERRNQWGLWLRTTSAGIIFILLIALLIKNWGTLGYVWQGILGVIAFCTLVGLIYGLIRIWLDIHARSQILRIEREKHEAEIFKLEEELRLRREQQEHEQQLEKEKHAAELALQNAQFALNRHISLTRVQPETYVIDHEVARVTAFPSLAGSQPFRETKMQGLPATSRPLQLPQPYDLLSVFRRLDISQDCIFLGKDEHSDLITIDAGDLCHGAFNAMTGGGKTTLERGILAQLLYIGHTVILADLKFTIETETGLDYRPIAKRLYEQDPLCLAPGYELPCLVRDEKQIADLLHFLAYDEINLRKEMRARRDFTYKTMDVFLEELVALILAYPQCAGDITRIIALGRELRVNLFTAAQNFLVKDTKLSGGARENFQTAYFLGGDEHSGALLLDMPKKELTDYLRENNIQLGKGVGMLRNNVAVPTASLTRLGWASNEAIYHLFGRADNFTLPIFAEEPRETPEREVVTEGLQTPELATAKKLWEQGNQSDRKLLTAMQQAGYTTMTLYQANQLARQLRAAQEKIPVND